MLIQKTEADSYREEAKTQIGAEQGELGVEIKGRTLVNLLGKDGNFETISPWQGWNATLALDQTAVRYGSNRIKVKINTGYTAGYVFKSMTMFAGKFYVVLSDVINGNATNVGVAPNTFGLGNMNTSTTAYRTSYKKFTPASDITTAIQVVVYGTEGQYAYVDGFRMYEISQAEYNAIDSMTEAQVAAKYPYVDSVQFKKDVLVTQTGKNMLPSLYSGEWTTAEDAYYTFHSAYSATVTNPLLWRQKYVLVNVVVGKTYTASVTVNNNNTSGTVGLYYVFYDANGTVLAKNFVCSTTATSGTYNLSGSITVPTNAVTCGIGLDNSSAFTGTCTFSNFQFELGSSATVFEPQVKSYAHTPMQIAQDESVWLTPNTSVYKEVWKKNVVLDGSLNWYSTTDFSGFKRATINVNNLFSDAYSNSAGTSIVTKYDGSVLSYVGAAWDMKDEHQIPSGKNLILTIADTDSGWTEEMNASSNEVIAYFYGWKMCASDGGTYVSGAKYWKKITDGTGITSTTPTASYAGFTPYVLHYKLTTPVYHINYYNNDPAKPIMSAGSIVNIPQGITQVEQLSGVQFREKGNPALSGTKYFINNTNVAGCLLSRRLKNKIAVYMNGNIFNNYETTAGGNSYGNYYLGILNTVYDSTAIYTVTYEQLDKYLYTVDTFAIDNPVPIRQRTFLLESTEQKVAYYKINPGSLVGATALKNPSTLADYGILDAAPKCNPVFTGKVGIGKTPTVALDVNGAISSSASITSTRTDGSNSAMIRTQNDTNKQLSLMSLGSTYSPYHALKPNTAAIYTNAELGIEADGANPITFWTNGVERMRITESGGLKLSSNSEISWPGNLLNFRSITSIGVLNLLGSLSGNYAPRLDIYEGTSTTVNVRLSGDSAQASHIMGKLGIGTLNPEASLEILNAVDPGIQIGNGTNKWKAYYNTSNNAFQISQIGVANRFYISGVNGNVGLGGVTDPKASFHSGGSTILGGGAIVGSNLGNSQFTIYIDEANSRLQIQAKYSNGTIKNGYVTLS